MKSVPFKAKSTFDLRGGYFKGQGTIRLQGDDIVVEVQVWPLPTFKQTVRTYSFDMTDLEEIRHTRRFWGDTLTLRTRPMERVTEIPGAANGALTLKVKRADRPALDAFLDRLELWLV
ncbi:hypothetical protein RQM47_06280 [Rubrivirga sp. S365]|uniref:hypothetical protein n=1 Tax=Rubrivirga sp. S365 TaxID=3076080 RepID=UPI0028CAE029|nr:hypothetical protein [Rubrivirga sp. S365]MDT7856240.1 hypothetical protein [Rubrivirga sp. S365]